MKTKMKAYSLLVMALLVMAIVPSVLAAGVVSTKGIDITTEDFAPLVWMCDNRVMIDDPWQVGTTDCEGGECELVERQQNYAFTGESLTWRVLVMDKNGINKIEDVYATVGDDQGEGNDIEVNCVEVPTRTGVDASCNARILEESVVWNANLMRYYECELHVEPDMQGEYWMTVEALDLDGLMGTMDENEFFFLNPTIALSIDGDIAFENVRPGTSTYSDTVLVGNDAEDGSGVRLEMFISGTNFYDSESSGAMCPTSNELDLSNFAYFGTNGAYATSRWSGGLCQNSDWCADAEGYMGIPYGDELREAKEIMGTEIYDDTIASNPLNYGDASNILTPGSEMALTFRLNLPEPCNGDFDSGSIFFWGEAI